MFYSQGRQTCVYVQDTPQAPIDYICPNTPKNIGSLYTAVGTITHCHLNFTTAIQTCLQHTFSENLKMLELHA